MLAWIAIDICTAAATHDVSVNDNFFSPAELTIAVGDTVRWTNAAGIHNVFSCAATQNGCESEVAAESFNNGLPRAGLWVFSHTFTDPGSNPYLCQSHSSFMQGKIVVSAPAIPPPPVPDGTIGSPMTVSKALAGDTAVTIFWDTESCGTGVRYRILHGVRTSFPLGELDTYDVAGGVCDVSPPFEWTPGAVAPGRFIWWVVVADDGDVTEGSWGSGALGERNSALQGGASGKCGGSKKQISECVP